MNDQDRVELELMKACKDAKGKDSRFVSSSKPCSRSDRYEIFASNV